MVLRAVLFVLMAGFTGSVFGQTLGGISGEVRDPSGAATPSARVSATNTETNVVRETLTNTDGIYTFPSLIPGTYTVKVEASGFQVMVRSNIELQVQHAHGPEEQPHRNADGRQTPPDTLPARGGMAEAAAEVKGRHGETEGHHHTLHQRSRLAHRHRHAIAQPVGEGGGAAVSEV